MILVTNRQYLQPMTLLDGDGPAESAEALCASKRGRPPLMRIRVHLLQSCHTAFLIPNADCFLHFREKNLPVSNLACSCGLYDGADCSVN